VSVWADQLVITMRHRARGKGSTSDGSDGLRCDAARNAVPRLEPCRERFRTFTCVAPNAAEGDVFASDDHLVVNDVLPRGPAASLRRCDREIRAAVDAMNVSRPNFSLKPVRDVPAVHGDRATVTVRTNVKMTGPPT